MTPDLTAEDIYAQFLNAAGAAPPPPPPHRVGYGGSGFLKLPAAPPLGGLHVISLSATLVRSPRVQAGHFVCATSA